MDKQVEFNNRFDYCTRMLYQRAVTSSVFFSFTHSTMPIFEMLFYLHNFSFCTNCLYKLILLTNTTSRERAAK